MPATTGTAVVYFEHTSEGSGSESWIKIDFTVSLPADGMCECTGSIIEVGGEHGDSDWIGRTINWSSAVARNRPMSDGSTGEKNLADQVEQEILGSSFIVSNRWQEYTMDSDATA